VTLASPASAAARNVQKGRQDVRGFEIEIVAGPVQVGWHRRNEIAAVLLAIGLALHQAGDLGDGVPLVGRLQWPAQQRGFADRLRRHARIDARRSQKQQLANAEFMGTVDDVGLHGEVVVEKVCRTAGVGVDAADPRRSEDDDVRLRLVHPGLDFGLLTQIEPVATDGDEFAVLARQPAHQRRPHHAAMAGNPDSASFDAERQFTHDSSLGA
jgi:hypothetical protein